MKDKLQFMLYGESKTGKTSALGSACIYNYEKTGKPVRYISADNGGWRPIQPLVNAGIIEPITLIGIDNSELWTWMRKLTTGWWPEQVDGEGRIVGEKLLRTPELESKYGGYLFEGLSSIAEQMLDGFAGKKMGMSPSISMKSRLDTTEILGTSAQDHYGAVQKEMLQALINSCSLPVRMVGWTAHESKGQDETTLRPIFGPAIVGQKATPKVGKHIGLLLHFDTETKEAKVDGKTTQVIEYKAHFQPHPDPIITTIPYVAGARVPPEKVPELLKRYPGGFVPLRTDGGLDDYLRFEDELMAASTDKWSAWKERVDGTRGQKQEGS